MCSCDLLDIFPYLHVDCTRLRCIYTAARQSPVEKYYSFVFLQRCVGGVRAEAPVLHNPSCLVCFCSVQKSIDFQDRPPLSAPLTPSISGLRTSSCVFTANGSTNILSRLHARKQKHRLFASNVVIPQSAVSIANNVMVIAFEFFHFVLNFKNIPLHAVVLKTKIKNICVHV